VVTVEQLIERLQEYPPHHTVFVEAYGDEDEATRVEATANATVTIS
jgi:hypothetical protein